MSPGGTTARCGLMMQCRDMADTLLGMAVFFAVRAEDSDGGSCVRGYLLVTIS